MASTKIDVLENENLVTLNINGTRFEIKPKIFKDIVASAFLELPEENKLEYYFDRHVPSFRGILDYFQRGELHLPADVCPNIFQRELQFWGLSDKKMEECCHRRFSTFLDDQQTLNVFDKKLMRRQSNTDMVNGCNTLKWKIWYFLENPKSSKWAKIYLVVSVIFVLMSLFVMAASTHPSCMRELNDEEFNGLYKFKFGSLPPEGMVPPPLQRREKRNLQKPPDGSGQPQPTAGSDQNSSNAGSDQLPAPPPSEKEESENESETLSDVHARLDFLTYMEYVAMAFFLLEFILRIATCPNKLLYFKNAVNICDVIALITMYVKLTVDHLQPSERYSISLFDFIGFLQIARVFRFFRIVKDVMGFRVLVYTIKMSTKELALLTMYLALCVSLFSVVVYYCERDNMKSIPDAMWWVVITMTTVGYGDMAPITFLGKIVGSLAAISGVLLLAVTIPVFVNNFILFYTYSKSMDFNKAQKEKKGSITTIKVSPLA